MSELLQNRWFEDIPVESSTSLVHIPLASKN